MNKQSLKEIKLQTGGGGEFQKDRILAYIQVIGWMIDGVFVKGCSALKDFIS